MQSEKLRQWPGDTTPLQISLDETTFDATKIEVQISINSSRNMALSDSLHLFIAATMNNVEQ